MDNMFLDEEDFINSQEDQKKENTKEKVKKEKVHKEKQEADSIHVRISSTAMAQLISIQFHLYCESQKKQSFTSIINSMIEKEFKKLNKDGR